jgi:hypothetical protein
MFAVFMLQAAYTNASVKVQILINIFSIPSGLQATMVFVLLCNLA